MLWSPSLSLLVSAVIESYFFHSFFLSSFSFLLPLLFSVLCLISCFFLSLFQLFFLSFPLSSFPLSSRPFGVANFNEKRAFYEHSSPHPAKRFWWKIKLESSWLVPLTNTVSDYRSLDWMDGLDGFCRHLGCVPPSHLVAIKLPPCPNEKYYY